jgi:3'(2'), 5'-bisphosphate nucleotidase
MNFPEMPAQASERIQIQTRTAPNELTAAISRTHLDPKSEQFLSHFRLAKRYGCGSSLKFCQIAQGDADIYPRLAQTCEWDIAAGAAILAAAGGRVTNPRGGDLRFAAGGDKFLVPGFVAWGDPAIVRKG